MRKRKLIEIGYLSIGMRKKYTASYVRDSEGRCDKIDVMVGDLPDLGNIRYPSFTKVEEYIFVKSVMIRVGKRLMSFGIWKRG